MATDPEFVGRTTASRRQSAALSPLLTLPWRAAPNVLSVFRIAVATDNHLGFLEKDKTRGNDSFLAVEEILDRALGSSADFLLLGGDLFHENKPSNHTIFRTLSMFRRTVIGNDRDVNFELLNAGEPMFSDGTGAESRVPNYYDDSLSIRLPVFIIHGNHDDPTVEFQDEARSALSLPSAARLLNYFGNSLDVSSVVVRPVLLRKGTTKIAMYGLGHIRDQRLNHLFTNHKVKFLRPEGRDDEWFNLLVVHQNRAQGRGTKNALPEHCIPDFFDLVIWAHEHECLIHPAKSADSRFFISQPGSSVATSLIKGESVPKHMATLEIRGTQFRLTPIPLRAVRPLVIREVSLAEEVPETHLSTHQKQQRAEETLARIAEELITEGAQLAGEREVPQALRLPLIRMVVDYTGFDIIPRQRFGAAYVGRVANPADMIFLKRARAVGRSLADEGDEGEARRSGSLSSEREEDVSEHMRSLVLSSLRKTGQEMQVLQRHDMADALVEFVRGRGEKVLNDAVDKRIESMMRACRRVQPTAPEHVLNVCRQAIGLEERRRAEQESSVAAARGVASGGGAAPGEEGGAAAESGRASSRATGRGAANGPRGQAVEEEEEEEEGVEEGKEAPPRTRQRTVAAAPPAPAAVQAQPAQGSAAGGSRKRTRASTTTAGAGRGARRGARARPGATGSRRRGATPADSVLDLTAEEGPEGNGPAGRRGRGAGGDTGLGTDLLESDEGVDSGEDDVDAASFALSGTTGAVGTAAGMNVDSWL